MHHRLSGISTYGLNGLGKGDVLPAFASLEYYGIFAFLHVLFNHYTSHVNWQTVYWATTVHCCYGVHTTAAETRMSAWY